MPPKASPLKRAIDAVAKAMEPQQFRVHEKVVACSVCGHDRFHNDYVSLLMMHTLICGNCQHIEFFRKQPESV